MTGHWLLATPEHSPSRNCPASTAYTAISIGNNYNDQAGEIDCVRSLEIVEVEGTKWTIPNDESHSMEKS